MGQTEGSSSHPHTSFFMGTLSSKGFLWALYSTGMWKIRFPIRLGKPSAWRVGWWHLWIHDSLLIHITQLQWQQETKCRFFSLNSQANNWTFLFLPPIPPWAALIWFCAAHNMSQWTARRKESVTSPRRRICAACRPQLFIYQLAVAAPFCAVTPCNISNWSAAAAERKRPLLCCQVMFPPWNAWNKKLRRYGEMFGRFAPCIFYGRCS